MFLLVPYSFRYLGRARKRRFIRAQQTMQPPQISSPKRGNDHHTIRRLHVATDRQHSYINSACQNQAPDGNRLAHDRPRQEQHVPRTDAPRTPRQKNTRSTPPATPKDQQTTPQPQPPRTTKTTTRRMPHTTNTQVPPLPTNTERQHDCPRNHAPIEFSLACGPTSSLTNTRSESS